MSAKERVIEIWKQHLPLTVGCTDGGRVFRKTVREQLMAEIPGTSDSAASTYYNHAKQVHEAAHGPIAGLGRAPAPAGLQKPLAKPKGKGKPNALQPDNECFAVVELVEQEGNVVVGRCQTFLLQGEASETFDSKVANWPNSQWVMIQGLGPLHGESFKLDTGEKEIKHYMPIAMLEKYPA